MILIQVCKLSTYEVKLFYFSGGSLVFALRLERLLIFSSKDIFWVNFVKEVHIYNMPTNWVFLVIVYISVHLMYELTFN